MTKTKTVYTNDQIPHLWAQHTQEYACLGDAPDLPRVALHITQHWLKIEMARSCCGCAHTRPFGRAGWGHHLGRTSG